LVQSGEGAQLSSGKSVTEVLKPALCWNGQTSDISSDSLKKILKFYNNTELDGNWFSLILKWRQWPSCCHATHLRK